MSTRLSIAVILCVQSCCRAYTTMPDTINKYSASNYYTGRKDGGVNSWSAGEMIDLNNDGFPDMVMSLDINDVTTSSKNTQIYLNTGCDFVDASTINSTNPLVMCTIHTKSAHALEDNRVADLLRGIELEHYAAKLADHEVNFETLLMLSDAELKEIGIKALGARKNILRATEEARAVAANKKR